MSESQSRPADDRVTERPALILEPGWSDDCDCLHPRAVMTARKTLGDAPPATEMAAIFAILADQSRMRMLTALGGCELCVTDLAAATGINRTTISHQLRILRGARLVRRRREGKVVYYALDDDHVLSLIRMATEHVAEAGLASRGVVSA